MSKEGIEGSIIGAARGEPLGADERARVDAALRASDELRELDRAQVALSGELDALRGALHGLEAAGRARREEVLLSVLRTGPAPGSGPRRRWTSAAGLAAAAVLAAVAVVTAWRLDVEPTGRGAGGRALQFVSSPPGPAMLGARPAEAVELMRAAGATGAAAAGNAPGGAFRPLMYAPRPSPWESYSIVRVRIPLAALAPGDASRGSVEADVLLGEDGLARAIRFDRVLGTPGAATGVSGGKQ